MFVLVDLKTFYVEQIVKVRMTSMIGRVPDVAIRGREQRSIDILAVKKVGTLITSIL